MIYVDELQPCRAPWTGRMSCYLISDESADELLSFAATIGLPAEWLQRRDVIAHFNLSPIWRARAVRGYAVEVTRQELERICRAVRQRQPAAPAPPPARG